MDIENNEFIEEISSVNFFLKNINENILQLIKQEKINSDNINIIKSDIVFLKKDISDIQLIYTYFITVLKELNININDNKINLQTIISKINTLIAKVNDAELNISSLDDKINDIEQNNININDQLLQIQESINPVNKSSASIILP